MFYPTKGTQFKLTFFSIFLSRAIGLHILKDYTAQQQPENKQTNSKP